MTTPATPHTISLQFADVNAMATAPIQNLSSATNSPYAATDAADAYPTAAQGPAAGALPPVYSKSGVIAFVEAEKVAGNPPYFVLEPTSTDPITPSVDPNYPYGDPSAGTNTVIAAQSSLIYNLSSTSPFAAPPSSAQPVHSPNLPGRWKRLNIDLAPVPVP